MTTTAETPGHGEPNQQAERLERPSVPELDQILGHPFRVLDDGFIRVVDYMGSDASIVQAARVSYGAGTKRVLEDHGLIRYLMRHMHTTPFEMCEVKFHVRAPMDCWRQWIRHRTASVNEYSTRYSVAIDAAQRTLPTEWRQQSQVNRQGSASFLDAEVGKALSASEKDLQISARKVYQQRLQATVAREQARKDLPLSTYTEAYWKINLHNLFHFLRLRLDAHAQHEIRQYATVIGYQVVAKWCPTAWDAFLEYSLNALNLTELELSVVKALIAGKREEAIVELENRKLLTRKDGVVSRNRERQELEHKLHMLGLPAPWVIDS
jgi:thymidylate synthase (FAD)